jgi:hypothetical protein
VRPVRLDCPATFRAGSELAAEPHVSFTLQTTAYGQPIWIPD